MITYTGVHVTQGFGAPTIRDIAVQSMRIPRFGACGELWWPVGMHLLLTADIVRFVLGRKDLEHYALLHDGGEMSGIGDICQPMKAPEQREVEHRVMARIYRSLGVRLPKPDEVEIVKHADNLSGMTEGASVIGPRGYAETQSEFRRSKVVEGLLQNYLSEYTPEEAIRADGRWALEYERRLRRAIRAARTAPTELPDKGL